MKRSALADAELALMELLWQSERLTARQIEEQLYPHAVRPQHGTVQKLLQRLEEKGFVLRDRSQHVHQFSATMGREAYASDQLEFLAERLTGGSLAPMLTQLVDEKKLTRMEISRLRKILEGA